VPPDPPTRPGPPRRPARARWCGRRDRLWRRGAPQPRSRPGSPTSWSARGSVRRCQASGGCGSGGCGSGCASSWGQVPFTGRSGRRDAPRLHRQVTPGARFPSTPTGRQGSGPAGPLRLFDQACPHAPQRLRKRRGDRDGRARRARAPARCAGCAWVSFRPGRSGRRRRPSRRYSPLFVSARTCLPPVVLASARAGSGPAPGRRGILGETQREDSGDETYRDHGRVHRGLGVGLHGVRPYNALRQRPQPCAPLTCLGPFLCMKTARARLTVDAQNRCSAQHPAWLSILLKVASTISFPSPCLLTRTQHLPYVDMSWTSIGISATVSR